MGKADLELALRDERVKAYLEKVVERKRFEDAGDLTGSEYLVMLYLGSKGFTSDIERETVERKGSRITKGLVGAKHMKISEDLNFLPAQVTRVTTGLREKDCSYQLTGYNCERIRDKRVREEVLSWKGSKLYEEVVDLLIEF
jgi:VIT1/CCC1 family predicted Fe2+/Mn2+ transporter